MSGTVGVIANDVGRWSLFYISLTQLKHPPNTRIDWGLSNDLAGARNLLVERSLEEGSEWIMFMDDDALFPADHLLRLLKHEKDVTCSLYLQRQQPFSPIAYSHHEQGTYKPLFLPDLPEAGLLKIHAAGCAGMLIRSEVFRAIEYPWFEHGRVGDLWNASEDLIFCEKANEAGFDIFLDLEARLGHMTPTAVWPSWVDQEWAVGFSVADGTRLYVPIEKAAEAADAVRR